MTTPATHRLVLLALDVDGDPAAVEALVARIAQVTRHRLHADVGATVGEARHLLVPEMTADDYLAAMASLKAPDVG